MAARNRSVTPAPRKHPNFSSGQNAPAGGRLLPAPPPLPHGHSRLLPVVALAPASLSAGTQGRGSYVAFLSLPLSGPRTPSPPLQHIPQARGRLHPSRSE